MELFTNESKVLVKTDSRTFEFKRGRNNKNRIKYTGNDTVPKGVVEWLEGQEFEVFVKPEIHSFEFRGPYNVNEAGEVFGIDVHKERYKTFRSLIDYGIRVSVKVSPNGETELVEVEGKELEDSVRIDR